MLRKTQWLALLTLLVGVAPLALRGVDAESRTTVQQSETEPFQGLVQQVDSAANRFVLENGTQVEIGAQTEVDATSEFKSLDEVSQALAAGERVRAEGSGTVESPHPKTVEASRVTWTRAS